MKLIVNLLCVLVLLSLTFCSDHHKVNAEIDPQGFIHGDSLTYNLPLSDLVDIQVSPDSFAVELNPSYSQTLDDLVTFNVSKVLALNTKINLTYDVPLEDLLSLDPTAYEASLNSPSYENMSLDGLMALEVIQMPYLKEKIVLSYDSPIEGLVNIQPAMLAVSY